MKVKIEPCWQKKGNPRLLTKKRLLAGFSLLELLIGMTVFAIIAASVYTSLYLGIKVWKHEENSDDLMQESMLTLEVLESKLRCAFMSPENDKLKFIADAEHIDFFSVDTEGDIEHVIFYLEHSDEKELFSLLMSTLKYVQLEEDLPQIKEDIVNTKIKSFKFAYFSRNDAKWYESWPEELELPQAVKIEVGFQGETGRLYELVKYINIPTAITINFSGNEKL